MDLGKKYPFGVGKRNLVENACIFSLGYDTIRLKYIQGVNV